MEWEEFKEKVKICREESNRLSGRLGVQVWCRFNLWIGDKKCIDVNPYCVNLKTGEYQTHERNLMTGKLIKVPNLKEL